MYKLTGDVQFKNKFGEFKAAIKGMPTTPGGRVHIQQWGSARHAANAAFLYAVSGKLANSQEDTQWAKESLNPFQYKLYCIIIFTRKII